MNALNLEDLIHTSIPGLGYREDFNPGLGGWRDKSGLTLTATSEPDIITIGTVTGGLMFGLKWDHTGTTTDFLSFAFTMPRQWAESLDDLQVAVNARKVDATADENTDLCLAANIFWIKPDRLSNPSVAVGGTAPTVAAAGDSGTSINSLSTAATAVLAACDIAATNNTMTGFGAYALDIGQRLRTEIKRIPTGSACSIVVYPHETVGTTDMDLEISIPSIRFRRHAGLNYDLSRPGTSPR